MCSTVSPDAISIILANPCSNSSSSSDFPEIIVQVLDLKRTGTRYMFSASDGKKKLKAILPSSLSSEVISGKVQNLGLIRILNYTVNDIPNKNEKCLIITKCEVVSSALEKEYIYEVKREASVAFIPKQHTVSKSAAQIVHEQHRNMAPSTRMSMTRRILPLASLNPYQGIWTIEVRVSNKGNLRTYKNARGEGCVFNVELTDEDGTQIQATMFNEAARKFFDKFQLGKVYYISKGSLKAANKQFKTVHNDYELTLNEYSEVEEASNEASFEPHIKYNFVSINELSQYINGKELVDVIGVVLNVSPTMSIRRKNNGDTVPKRDITISDTSNKSVVISLWNDLATGIGQELLDMSDKYPIVAIKSVKVGDFQGLSLSTLSRSTIEINPDLLDATKLRTWFDSEGKDTLLASIGASLSPSTKSGAQSLYSDRVSLFHITSNPSLGENGKPIYFSVKADISFIKPDQTMWYRACKTCNKKVIESIESGKYWCEECQKNNEEYSLRYIMSVKVCDASGEAWLSLFNEQAEKIIGCSADELDNLKSQEGENGFQMKLKEATWMGYVFRVSVMPQVYNNERKQKITVRSVASIDYAAESRFMLQQLSKV